MRVRYVLTASLALAIFVHVHCVFGVPMTNIENLIDPDPKPYSPPNEVPGTSPDEVTPGQGDTDFPGSIPNETPMESPVTDPN